MTILQSCDDAIPISPPFWCRVSSSYALRIEYRAEEYIVKWTDPTRQPSLSQFPRLETGIRSEKVDHNPKEAEIWASSYLCAFGSYAQVRKAKAPQGSLPMYKIAHRTEASLFFIWNEFQILQQLRSLALPIVKVGDPLIDIHGIFGFSMEELHPINPRDILLYYNRIENAVHKLHEQGYVHADIVVNNLMVTDEDNIRLIDFGQAGKHEQPLPKQHPLRKFGKQKFEFDMDFERLERLRQQGKEFESPLS